MFKIVIFLFFVNTLQVVRYAPLAWWLSQKCPPMTNNS